MQEIKIKNKAELKVYINGVPEIKNIPQDVLDCFISYLGQSVLDKIKK